MCIIHVTWSIVILHRSHTPLIYSITEAALQRLPDGRPDVGHGATCAGCAAARADVAWLAGRALKRWGEDDDDDDDDDEEEGEGRRKKIRIESGTQIAGYLR